MPCAKWPMLSDLARLDSSWWASWPRVDACCGTRGGGGRCSERGLRSREPDYLGGLVWCRPDILALGTEVDPIRCRPGFMICERRRPKSE